MLFHRKRQRRLRSSSSSSSTSSWITSTAGLRRPALVAVTVLTVLCYCCPLLTCRFISRRENKGDDTAQYRLLSLTSHSTSSTTTSSSSVDLTVQSQQQQRQRVIVVTVWSHYPDLMPLQIASVRAFLRHPIVEIIAVTNAKNYTQRWELDRVARQLNVHVLPVHNAWKYQDYPSLSHINALNFVMQALLRGNNNDLLRLMSPFPLLNDILFFLDSDMFLMEPVSLVQELNGAALLSPLQTRENKHTYLWPNLSVFSFGEWTMQQQQKQQQQQQQQPATHWMEGWTINQWLGLDEQQQQTEPEEPYKTLYKELNFDACFPECPCDCGGCTKYLMERHPDLRVKNWTNTCSSTMDDSTKDATNTNVCQFWKEQTQIELPSKCTQPQVFGPIYHLGSAGSNWRGCDEDFLRQRRQDLFHQMRKVLPKDIYDQHKIVFEASST